MRLGTVQVGVGSEKDLLELILVGEAIIRVDSSVQCDVIHPMISSLRAKNPYSGPGEGESSGGMAHRRQRERPTVIIPKLTGNNWHQKLPKKKKNQVERTRGHSRLPEGIRGLSRSPRLRG